MGLDPSIERAEDHSRGWDGREEHSLRKRTKTFSFKFSLKSLNPDGDSRKEASWRMLSTRNFETDLP